MSVGDWLKNIALHLGLGIATTKVDVASIRTAIYAITDTQIHARTFIPLTLTERLFFLVPIKSEQKLIDEELITLLEPSALLVQARQELDVPGVQSVRTWHATFHRISQ